MKKSKIIVAMGLFMLLGMGAYAQQESQYTQYMYNPILINPAYAGSRGVPSIFGLHRSQWVGLDGAPKTSALSFHMPFESKKVGLGASIYHETIGPQTTNTVMIDFSYTLHFNNDSKLAFGLKGTGGFYNFDWNKIHISDPNDPWRINGKNNIFSPNVGVGVYWYTDNYYLGVSVPNLLTSRTFSRNANNIQHYYLIAGYVFDLSESVKFKPAALSKVVKGSPLQVDLSANFMFNDKFVLGAAYRWSAAVSLMAGFQVNQNWFIGYAYDWETTDLRRYNSGSHEIFLRYEFMRDLRRVISPRFF